MRKKFICPRCETFVETDIDVDGYAVCPKCENDIYLPYFRETSLQSRVEELEAQLAARDALIERLVEAGDGVKSYAVAWTFSEQYVATKKARFAWDTLVAEYRASKESVE